MPWFVLIASAVLEAVWATALGRTEGFTALVATVVFAGALLGSLAGLGWAARHIPIGSAYAVWTGLGAALTVGYAMLTGDEASSPAKVLFLTGIVAAVVGLKLLPPDSAGRRDTHEARPSSVASSR
ncbi:quaternary ammonium compound-resistance protein SugE [Mycolicibacterium iranicum]|uniref:Quaternary ammonium compound-resistance protein SugE n=1 Tax=Mycolicibacterium iranicum TaxID=912594 RepID=A0A839Q8J0_MYCIR|nr:multidrug efflux SMR transporter [Mycolicibacterium iranicum]MBB2989542.1 quaternary ammonium compound-resistance protein SugE [Mycolicibacterium iranicum]